MVTLLSSDACSNLELGLPSPTLRVAPTDPELTERTGPFNLKTRTDRMLEDRRPRRPTRSMGPTNSHIDTKARPRLAVSFPENPVSSTQIVPLLCPSQRDILFYTRSETRQFRANVVKEMEELRRRACAASLLRQIGGFPGVTQTPTTCMFDDYESGGRRGPGYDGGETISPTVATSSTSSTTAAAKSSTPPRLKQMTRPRLLPLRQCKIHSHLPTDEPDDDDGEDEGGEWLGPADNAGLAAPPSFSSSSLYFPPVKPFHPSLPTFKKMTAVLLEPHHEAIIRATLATSAAAVCAGGVYYFGSVLL